MSLKEKLRYNNTCLKVLIQIFYQLKPFNDLFSALRLTKHDSKILEKIPVSYPAGLEVMSVCGRKALTLLSSVFAVCSLGLLGIAVSTDYWLYLEEGIILPLNQSTEIRMSLHSGLWRVCFLAGEGSVCICVC